jgi:hypothetical protein
VRHVLGHCTPEMPLAERNQAIQAFFLDRPHESLRVSIRIRGALRDPHDTDTRRSEPIATRRDSISHPDHRSTHAAG